MLTVKNNPFLLNVGEVLFQRRKSSYNFIFDIFGMDYIYKKQPSQLIFGVLHISGIVKSTLNLCIHNNTSALLCVLIMYHLSCIFQDVYFSITSDSEFD